MPEASDFFVSYNRHDKEWAEWIAWELERAGYSSIIQAWDFRPGSNFVIEMQIGLSSADRTILVLSANYLKSEFTAPEWAAVFSQDPQGLRRKLVPVRVAECAPIGLLTSIVYIDLVGKEEVEARRELLAGIYVGRAKPQRAPEFPIKSAPVFPTLVSTVPIQATIVEHTQCTIVLTGTIDPHDRPVVEAILEHLKKIAQHAELTIVETKPGSIKVTFEGPRDACERFVKLFERGRVSEVAGLPVEKLRRRLEDGREIDVNTSYALMFDDNYGEICRLAEGILKRERHRSELEPDDLANNAAVAMLHKRQPNEPVFVEQFKAIVGRRMIHSLVDSIRRVRAAKLGSRMEDTESIEAPDIPSVEPVGMEQRLDLNRALEELAEKDRLIAQVVDLRFFAGMTLAEIANALNISQMKALRLSDEGITFYAPPIGRMTGALEGITILTQPHGQLEPLLSDSLQNHAGGPDAVGHGFPKSIDFLSCPIP